MTVPSVKFANDDKSRVACCSLDGTLSVCQVLPSPATVICILKGHSDGVTGKETIEIGEEVSKLTGISFIYFVPTNAGKMYSMTADQRYSMHEKTVYQKQKKVNGLGTCSKSTNK